MAAVVRTRVDWGWCLPALLAAALWAPVLRSLGATWMSDPTVSHGPVVLLLAAGHLWLYRKGLTLRGPGSPHAAAIAAGCGLLLVAAYWLEIEVLKPVALVGLTAAGVGWLGGRRAGMTALACLGLLLLAVPWPTTLVERLAFPLQLGSSSYAAMLCGLLGLPVQRDGVHLAALDAPGGAPVYTILVARQCSGLTSLQVLLTLGYLVALHTPGRIGPRVGMVLAVAPLALLTNAVRLALVLFAGAYHSPGMAQWIHDHEAPVLIALCTTCLLLARKLITGPQPAEEKDAEPLVPQPVRCA